MKEGFKGKMAASASATSSQIPKVSDADEPDCKIQERFNGYNEQNPFDLKLTSML